MFIKWDKETRRKMIEEIQRFYYEENGEEIGEISAVNFLEFVDNQLAKFYYNEGVNQAMRQWEQSAARLEEDLFSLKRPVE